MAVGFRGEVGCCGGVACAGGLVGLDLEGQLVSRGLGGRGGDAGRARMEWRDGWMDGPGGRGRGGDMYSVHA